MKKFLFLAISCCYLMAEGQNAINTVTISLPANPPANIADWSTANPPVMIQVGIKPDSTRSVPGFVRDAVVLVSIKNGGGKVCGSFTSANAPAAAINGLVKLYRGAEVVKLLGQSCTLAPGTYTLCVQFFYNGKSISEEINRQFIIKGNENEHYSLPQNILPVNEKIITVQEAKIPVNFRWTPVLPRPREDVVYRLKVWQLMQGQSPEQAIRSNQPIVTKDVDNLTQVSIDRFNNEPCMLPYLCSYVWNVEAQSKELVQGKIKSFGVSEVTAFSVTTGNTNPVKQSQLENQLPINGKVFTKEEVARPLTFSWKALLTESNEKITYQLRLWPQKKGQSTADAVKNNRPVFSKETFALSLTTSVCDTMIKPCECPCAGDPFLWNVTALKAGKIIAESEIFTYAVSTAASCCTNGSWYNKNWYGGGPLIGSNGIGRPPAPLPPTGTSLGRWLCDVSSYAFYCSFACGMNCNNTQINYSVYNSASGIMVSSLSVQNATYASIPAITVNGKYVLVIAAVCGKDTCANKLEYPFEINCATVADCCQTATQKDPSVYDAAGTNLSTFNCVQPQVYFINALNKNCDKELTVKASANCGVAANCTSKIVYTLVNSSTSTTINSTGFLTIPATLANGAYILTVDYYCGSVVCKSCKFEIRKDCQQATGCCQNSSWGDKLIIDKTGTKTALPPCGTKLGLLECNSIKTLLLNYNCSQGCGSSQIKYQIYNETTTLPVGSPVTVSSGIAASITTPGLTGNYYLQIDVLCNGKLCNTCKYFFTTNCAGQTDCCKGSFWTSKSLDWDMKTKFTEDISVPTAAKENPKNKTSEKNKTSIATSSISKIPVDFNGAQLNPVKGSIKVNKCGDTLRITEGSEFTLNAGYTCNAALANCKGKVVAQIKNPAGIIYGTWPLPHLFNFTTSGVYTATYYAYCGEKICDSCTFYVNAEKDCCSGSKWIKADYQVVNKKPDGSWLFEPGFFPLPTTIAPPIPVYKADLGINIEHLNYKCAEGKGCSAGYIVRRKNLTTGALVYPDEILSPGQVSTSVYSKPFPQIITITPTCAGKACGNPIIFKVECLHKDCLFPCIKNDTIKITTGVSEEGTALLSNQTDPFWMSNYGAKVLSSGVSPFLGSTGVGNAATLLQNVTGINDIPFYSATRAFYVCKPGVINFKGKIGISEYDVTGWNSLFRAFKLYDPSGNLKWTFVPGASGVVGTYVTNDFNGSVSVSIPGKYTLVFEYNKAGNSWNYNSMFVSGMVTTAGDNLSNTSGCCVAEISDTISDCKNQLVRNGDFVESMVSGSMPSGSVLYWAKGYGNPYLSNTPGTGCFDDGLVKLTGNLTNGNAIIQNLNTANQIIFGKKYKVSIAVRFKNNLNTIDYGKIRVIAFNGTLPVTGAHPMPNSNIAVIGRSSKIKDCNDWSVIEFDVWKANKNFQSIAINAFTNDNNVANVLIDNVVICEVDASDCAEVQVDNNGAPVTPDGYGVGLAGNACQPEVEEDEYSNGSLVDLYNYNGTFQMYETLNQEDCTTIGGTLPDEIINYNCSDSLKAYNTGVDCDSLETLINSEIKNFQDTVFVPVPIQPLSNISNECANLQKNSNTAFNGRDIIFIHGLQLKHLIDKGLLDPRAIKNWPLNKSEFYSGGYYKQVAEDNWKPHIDQFIKNHGLSNRYFIASYNCSERADIALYNVMLQIREAMENGTDVVVPDKNDSRGKRCFGKSFVIVSHSTGGLIGDLVLSISNESKTNMVTQALYGNVGFIADRCKGHVAMHGAMGGSNLAKIVVASGLPIVMHSILVDLTPTYTYTRWALNLNKVPVPVFTVSGGHPAAQLGAAIGVIAPLVGPLTGSIIPQILPGIDDGVVNMESGSGRNQPPNTHISQFVTLFPVKAFDMGIKRDRAISFFIDQIRINNTFSISSSPYLTQNGMVEPKLSVSLMHPQFSNHFTFIQSPSEHLQPANVSYYSTCNYKNTIIGSVNNEEVLVTNENALYTSGLINPTIISEMEETIRDKHVSYPWMKVVWRKGIPRPTVYWKKFYIWKRTYHMLRDNCMYDMDYAYKYLFTN